MQASVAVKPLISSKPKGPGEEGAAAYCPKILLPKRAKMLLCSFYRSYREICTRNRPLSETKFLDDFWGPLPLPAPLFYCSFEVARVDVSCSLCGDLSASLATGDRIFATGSDSASKTVLRSCGCLCLISGIRSAKHIATIAVLRSYLSPPVFTVRSGPVWRQHLPTTVVIPSALESTKPIIALLAGCSARMLSSLR